MPPKSLTGRVLSESVIEVHGIPYRQIIYEGGRTYLEPLAAPATPQAGLESPLAARQARREYGRRKRESGG